MKIRSLCILVATTILTGCAFTVHDLPVNYQYSGAEIALSQERLPEVIVEEVTDSRSVENPRMIMHQRNGYGQTTSGGWQAEKELALIVKDALDQGLEKAGLNSESTRKVSIKGQLVDVSSSIVSGWASGTISVKVSVKLTARDQSGKVLWRDTIFGDSTSEKVTSVKIGLSQAFNAALDNLVSNFLNDDYFQQQVID